MKHLILVLLFLIIHPVSAQEYVVRYTIKSTAGYHSSSQAISPSPTESKITGGVKAKGQNISVVGDLRGDSSSIDNVSEKTETRKIARINPPKINKEIGDIEPFNKYLTEQGIKTREIVLAHLSKYYSGNDLIASDNILKKEAGYRYDAINEIGACGIVQALPCEKLGCPLTEEGIICQTQWFIGYLNRRYGSPTNAWKFHLENNWY